MLSGLSGYIKGVKKAIGNMGTAHQTTPTLGRLRIGSRDIEEIKLISQGGYAYVFQVRDTQTGEIFALKKMICQSPERVQTAKNEINYLRSLPNHPNLLKVFDTHVDNKDGCYYVYVLLEFCADGSIFDLMAKYESTRLAEKQIIFIMREVCEGVKALHSMRPPIAHRDLKIENVLLNNKRFKLCDFGSCSTSVVDFAKVPQSQYHIYEEEYDKNTTLMYRPPEMCDPYQKLVVSEKADVWMLGCILYTMCFYKHPFQEMSKLSIVNAAYTFPKEHNYAPKLIDIIRLLLTPNPNTRPSIFDVCKIFDNYFELTSIKLNPDAQRIKEEQRKQEQEMAKFENNSSNLPKFNGDIPVQELMKLQQQLAHDDSSPVHVRQQTLNRMSQKQSSHGKLHPHKNSSDFDSFGDSSKPKTQVPDLHQFHSSPGLNQGNKDWFSFDDKPKISNHQSAQQSSFAPNQQLKANNQVNAQWSNFDFGSTPNSNQQPNNNNNNNQWASWNSNQGQNQTQQQQKPVQQQQTQHIDLMNNNPQPQPQMQQQPQTFNQQQQKSFNQGFNQGGFNQQQQQPGWNQNMNMMNKQNPQMNNGWNGWGQSQNQNQNMQMQNNMNNMNRMQQPQMQMGWNNQPNMQNFNSQNGFSNNNNNMGFQQNNNNNNATVTNNLLDLADNKPVRLDTASGIMSLYGKK